MYKLKSKLSKKEKIELTSIIIELEDKHKEFYLTINNKRLFIKEHLDLLFKCLNKGDKIIYDENSIMLITGFFDNAKRKYLRILGNENQTEKMLEFLGWNFNIELYCKLKRYNPIVKILLKKGFFIYKNRGKELLLCRKPKYRRK